MRTQMEKAEAFRALHARPGAFIIPNPWEAGTAKLLAAMGFEALATTSLGLANMLKGGSPQTSQKLMRLRVLMQFVALVIIMITIWVVGH